MATLLSLSSDLISAIGLTIKSPGYLIEIDWPSGTTRVATFADITALGFDWMQDDVKVTQWGIDNTGKATFALEFGNTTLEWGVLSLGDSVSDVPVAIHQVYAGVTTDADILQNWFVGVLNGMKMPAGKPTVQFSLVRKGDGALYVPRDVLGPEVGCNYLMPAGKVIAIGGQSYVFQSSQK